ncbi:peptidase M14 [Mycena maculata]|uniref:Peptidase M14 n=1 Tax=Mycena maculata TaxID=230809 RepID=A0AAD7IZK9_9AGAR|nr:peptidase M14 [Mycena maculata]
MFQKHLWGAVISLPCVIAALEQHIFAAPTPDLPGILRRFSPNDSDSLAEVLKIAQAHNLDIWQIGRDATPHVDIYFPPSSDGPPGALLSTPHSMTNISVPDPNPQPYALGTPGNWTLDTLENTTFHAEYHPQWEVDAFIHEMARTHPESVTILRLGHSGEGREILGMKISASGSGTPPVPKLGFVVLGPQHAREWVATSTALYIAHALLSKASETKSLSYLLEVYDFHIIPSPNPDGYVYTWESDRFWYKNRQIVGPGAKCIGIDMNRNWGSHWKPHSDNPLLQSESDDADGELMKKKKKKEPADPCSHWYPGHHAFEAPEVNNLANYITAVNGIGKGANKGGLVAFLDLRSYGQMLAAPYSYKCDKMPKDAEDQMEALHGAAAAGKALYGTVFATGSLCELLYSAPGNILDYIYTAASIKYSYAAFLRDTGTYGFALPPAWIRPVGEETGLVVDYLAHFITRQRDIEL